MVSRYDAFIELAAQAIEVLGVMTIVIGAAIACARFLAHGLRSRSFGPGYPDLRASLGRAILLGLEFLVAGDIIATIIIEPTLEKLTSLGVLVLIRTFLSFSVETEIEGRLPWQAQKSMADEEALRSGSRSL